MLLTSSLESPPIPQWPGRSTLRTLLIVDDDEGPRQALEVVFGDDYRILTAEHGREALHLAQTRHVDVVILDIRMAGLSGLEVLQQLKAIDPRIEVIMLTGFGSYESVRKALRLGAIDYLSKPFEIPDIRRAVTKAIEHRRVTDEIQATRKTLEELQASIRSASAAAKSEPKVYASILHDIRNPLSIINGFIELIQGQLADSQPLAGDSLEQLRTRLRYVTRQLDSCLHISQRYLQVVRTRSEGPPSTWINPVLAELATGLGVHPAAGSNQILVQSLPRDARVGLHETELQQLLMNLAVNALRATDQPHRVEIRGRLLTQPVDLTAVTEGLQERWMNRDGLLNQPPLVALHVQDTGPGIPSNVLTSIFDKVFPTNTNSQGSGLGLSIVAWLVKEAQGAIHCQTGPGKGTQFIVYLRLLEPGAGTATTSKC